MTKNSVKVVTRLGVEGFPDIYDLQYCLNGQSDCNFEWIILLRPSAHKKFNQLIQELKYTSELFPRIKIYKVKSDSRGGILNVVLKNYNDGMIVVLDDDDIPLPNYIEVINKYAQTNSFSSIVRTLTFSQETFRTNEISSSQISMSKGLELWPRNFKILSHLEMNRTPCMSASFPIKIIKNLDLKWDETLSALEDWDFLMRAAQIIPVESVEIVTSLYRKPQGAYRSQVSTSRASWKESEGIVREKLNDLKFEIRGLKIIESQFFQQKNTDLTLKRAPNYYVRIVRYLLPLATKLPGTYNYLRTVHRKIIAKMNWSFLS